MLTRARGALALIVALLVLAATSPATAQKQTVVIYTAIENEQIAEYKKAYEKAMPNLDVKMLRLSTGDIAARFMAEKDNMQADVIWGVAATNILVFKQAGLLEPYAPKGLARVAPLFRDKDATPSWVGIDAPRAGRSSTTRASAARRPGRTSASSSAAISTTSVP